MSGFIASLDGLAESWAHGMWPVVWQSAALALVILCLTSVLRRAPAAVRFWLWMLVPLRLAVTPLLTVGLPVLPPEQVSVAPSHLTQVTDRAPGRLSAEASAGAALRRVAETDPPAPATASESAGVPARASVWSLLVAAWVGGMALMCLRLAKGWHQARRTVVRAVPASDRSLLDAASEVARTLGLRRVPRILLTEERVTPFVWGVLSPAVVLPAGLIQQVSRDELEAVLAHELAHVRRRDPLLGWLVALCEAGYWFHPACHLARRHLMRERERACDDCVLALGRSSRSLYANALIAAARSCSSTRPRLLPIVTAAESFGQLRQRIAHIFADLRRTARLSRATVAVLVLLAAVSVPGIALTARSAPAEGEDVLAEEFPQPTGEMVAFKGIVTDLDGQPIAGAHVRCDLTYGKRRPMWQAGYAETRTDEAGRFTFGPLPVFKKGDANYFFICEHPDYAIGKSGSWWPGKADPGDVHVKLAPPAVVSGRVTDEDGKGVPGATVEAELQLFYEREMSYDYFDLDSYNGLAVQTDGKGRFEFQRVPDVARVHLRVTAPGYACYSTKMDYPSDPFPIRAGEKDETVVLEPGGTIEGRLTLNGKPYRENGIPVFPEGGMRAQTAFTDAEGRFVMSGLRAGTYSIAPQLASLPDPDMACVPAVGIELGRGATVKSVEIALFKGPMVSGVVLNERTGDPAPGAFVCAWKGESVVSRGKTGADGRYHLPVPPGEFEIGVQVWQHNRSGWVKEPVRVSDDGPVGDVDFSVRVRETLHGRLIDEEGRPLRGTVKLGDTVETAEDGTFSMPEPFGRAEDVEVGLAFDKQKKLGRGFLWRRSDMGKELELILEPLVGLTGRFVDDDGRPLADVEPRLHIAMQGGLSVGFSPRHSPWQMKVAEDGSFTVIGVPVGLRVQVYGQKRGFVSPSRDYVEPAAGQTVDLGAVTMRRQLPGKPAPGVDPDAAVEWSAALSGRILNEEGKPVRGARIWADVGPGAHPEDNTDRRGRFRLAGLPTGRLIRLSAYYAGYGHTSFRDVRTGQKDLELHIFPQGYEWYGKPAPPLVVHGWANCDPIVLDDLRGNVVLLQVGIHIAHYSQYADRMRAAVARYGDEGLAIIAVHTDLVVTWPRPVTEEEIAAYLTEHKITWPVALDAPSSETPDSVPRERVGYGNGATWSVYDVKASPALYLIDKRGILRCSPTTKNLNEWIERLLAE